MVSHLLELFRNPAVWVLLLGALLLGIAWSRQYFQRDSKAQRSKSEGDSVEFLKEPDNESVPESRTEETHSPSPTDSSSPRTPDPVPTAAEFTTGERQLPAEDAPQNEAMNEAPEILTERTHQREVTSQPDREESETVIKTRTGHNPSRKKLIDPFESSERNWSVSETSQAVELYHSGKPIFQIARIMRIDQKQVAILLIRELFDYRGEVNDVENAPRNGKSYTDDELSIMVSYFEAGSPIQDTAAALERTVLGVGWRMLDRHMV